MGFMKAYLNQLNFTPIEKLKPSDKEAIQWILDHGYIPLSDYFDPINRVTWDERLKELQEWLDVQNA